MPLFVRKRRVITGRLRLICWRRDHWPELDINRETVARYLSVKVGRIEASQVQMENDLPTLVLMPGLDGTGSLFERFACALPPNVRTRIIKYPQHAAQLEEYAAVVAEG